MGATNEFERKNYPIGTQGGGTGICPSQNLVEAYESTGEDTGDAAAGDPARLLLEVLGPPVDDQFVAHPLDLAQDEADHLVERAARKNPRYAPRHAHFERPGQLPPRHRRRAAAARRGACAESLLLF